LKKAQHDPDDCADLTVRAISFSDCDLEHVDCDVGVGAGECEND
jgi:hypothetical protein